MHPLYLRQKARQLRVDKKLTIDELAECLALSRSTIYYWVRDIPVPRKTRVEWPESARLAGSRAVRKKFRLLREAAYAEGRATFVDLCADPTFRDFVNLYIAEGYKRCRNQVALANSDPAVMKIAAHWIRRFSASRITYSIQYHADQNLVQLRAFWGSTLDIDPASIRLQRKSNSNQLSGRRWRSRYGVLTVAAGDTYLHARLQAWMDCLREQWVDSA
jgi:predicted DNA-binding transcriptional regulator AlpA